MAYALLVIDYQNDFVVGSLGSTEAKAIESNIVAKIEKCLEKKGGLFFTMDTHDSYYLDTDEGRHIPVKHCIKGTPGWELHGKVAEFKNKGTVVEKGTFGSLDLIDMMKGYNEVELCGVATNICVMSNAVILKAAYPESKISIDTACVASYNMNLHREALDVMRSLSIDISGNI